MYHDSTVCNVGQHIAVWFAYFEQVPGLILHMGLGLPLRPWPYQSYRVMVITGAPAVLQEDSCPQTIYKLNCLNSQ